MYKRGNRTYIADYTTKDVSIIARRDYNVKLSRKKFSEALELIINYIFELILEEGDEYRLPKQLGTLRVKRIKFKLRLGEDGNVNKNSLIPNFHACKQLWKSTYPDKSWEEIKNIKYKPMVYFLNKHTNGYYNKFYWDKRTSTVKNQSLYKINIVRERTAQLSLLSKQNKIYYE